MIFSTPTTPTSDILFQASPFENIGETAAVPPAEPSSKPKESARETSSPKLAFEDFAEMIRSDLPANSILEKVLVERVILASWRLHLASEHDVERVVILDRVVPVTPEILRAECSLETAFSLLETARRLSRPRWGCTSEDGLLAQPNQAGDDNADEIDSIGDFSNEWPILHADSNPRDAFREVNPATIDDEEIDDESAGEPMPTRWQARLVFDFNVSETSPVVKGTWITVSHVVSLIVDGCRWSDILRDHPELTEEDIRTCLAYTVEQDNFGDV